MNDSSNHALVALLTAPTILWLFVRFAVILHKHRGPVLFHLRQSLADAASFLFRANSDPRKPSHWSSIALVAHILLGLLTLSFAPYLAYRCVPPGPTEETFSGKDTLPKNLLTAALAVTLVLVNASVLWLVPHPKRHEAYGCSRRLHVKGWTCLVVPATEFSAMAVAALGIMVLPSVPLARLVLVSLSVVLYMFSAAACFKELSRSATPWEETVWGRIILQHAPRGPVQKSKLLERYVGGTPSAMDVVLICFLIPAAISIIQNSSMVVNWVFRPRPIPPGQEEFFVVFSLYSTLTMCAGFFTQAQLGFELGTAETKGDVHLTRRLQFVLVVEVFLTQIFPLFLLVLGPKWTGHETTALYNVDWIFWTSSSVER